VHRGFLDDGDNAPPYLERALDHIEAQDRRRAAGGAAECGQDLQGCGFPGAVWSQQAEYSAALDREAEGVYRANGAERFDDVVDFESVSHAKLPIWLSGDLVIGGMHTGLCITGGACIRRVAEDQRMTAGIFIAVSLKKMLLRSEEYRQHGPNFSIHQFSRRTEFWVHSFFPSCSFLLRCGFRTRVSRFRLAGGQERRWIHVLGNRRVALVGSAGGQVEAAVGGGIGLRRGLRASVSGDSCRRRSIGVSLQTGAGLIVGSAAHGKQRRRDQKECDVLHVLSPSWKLFPRRSSPPGKKAAPRSPSSISSVRRAAHRSHRCPILPESS